MKNPFKTKFIKLSPADKKEILKIQKSVQSFSGKQLWNWAVRKKIQKLCDAVLKKYNFEMGVAIEECHDYGENVIEFIEINLPFNMKLTEDRADFKEFQRLKKKFGKNLSKKKFPCG